MPSDKSVIGRESQHTSDTSLHPVKYYYDLYLCVCFTNAQCASERIFENQLLRGKVMEFVTQFLTTRYNTVHRRVAFISFQILQSADSQSLGDLLRQLNAE